MPNLQKKEKSGISGKITVKTYHGGTIDAALPFYKIAKLLSNFKLRKTSNFFTQIAKMIMDQGYISTALIQKNLIMQAPNVGLDLIIQRLIGTNTYSLNITYGEIGIGNTAPTLNDTALGNASVRVPTTYSQDYGNQDAIVQFFFIDSNLPNQTYYEFGTFVDGSASLGSGQLFNHALFATPYIKNPGQDTTVEVDFSIANG